MPPWISTPHIPPDHRGPTGRRFTPFENVAGDVSLLDRLAAIVHRHPDSIAFVDADSSVTFAALWQRVLHLSEAMDSAGPDDGPVGILLPGDSWYVVTVFACLFVGRVAVLLDASLPAARNNAIAATSGLSLLVARRDAPRLSGLATLDPETIAYLGDRPMGSHRLARTSGLDAPAFILSTSGSSGLPKLIVHSQRTMLHWARTTHDGMHVTPADCVLSLSSPSALGGFVALLSTPLAGAAVRLLDIKSALISGLLKVLVAEPVTILRAAPSFLRSVVRLSEVSAAFRGLRIVQSYGEPLLMADVRALRNVLPPTCLIRSTYGSTEASGMTWFAEPDDAHDPILAPAGVLMPDTEAAVLGDDGRPCAADEPGELVIRSRYNALGEWIEGRLCGGRLEPDEEDLRRRIYRTGDIARHDGAGVFVVLGRKDRMLNINGQRVEPAEIEAIIRRRSDVSDVCVIPSLRQGNVNLIACIVAADGALADATFDASIWAELRAALPAFMVPSRLIRLSALPRLPSGKVDERALLMLASLRP